MSYTDSIMTEDYANKFNECLIPGGPKSSLPSRSYKFDIDQDSVFAEDIETKIRNQNNNFKYANPNSSDFDFIRDGQSKPMEFDEDDAFNVERKYQEILRKRRNRAGTYLQPFQSLVTQYPENFRYADDQNTVMDDLSMEIKHKKNEIQMDLERERRRNRSISPKIKRNGLMDHSSPRETLERKVVELDQLSSTVQQATLEHQKLCKELQDMQFQLRKNQAEVRLSERMAVDNKERIGIINKELRAAESRRDQTMRHLDLVNEELALKRAKLKSFNTQMTREMANIRKMDQYGIDKEEIERILAERDELYQIVKRQEDARFEKYELSKQLDMMRDDLYTEQDRAARQIENLEDELECSLKKMKQLQFEKDELEAQFDHFQHHLCRAEEEACKSSREVSELRDEYQNRIKRKLDEYEIDKERVERELRKLEDEKSTDEANLKNQIENLKQDLLITEKEKRDLKELVAELEEHVRKATVSRFQLSEDHERKIRQLHDDKEHTLQKQKKDLLNEQRLLLDEKDIQHGHERNKIQKQCNNEMDLMVKNIQMKDKEISEIYDRLQEAESSFNDQLQKEKIKFENILHKEKMHLQDSNNEKTQNKINKIRYDYEVTNKSLTNHVEQLTSTLKGQDTEISALKQEISNVKIEHQKLINENLSTIRKMKDSIKQETTKELKARYEEKMDKELMKIKSDFDKKTNSKISSIVKEKTAIEESDKRTRQLLCKIVKTVVHEINGECAKMAVLLNVHPRNVDHSKISEDLSKSDNLITQAIANLEACGSEIRGLLEELETKAKSLTTRMESDELKMEGEIRNIRFELNAEKLKDISKIRENLLKEHLKEINRLAKSPDIGMEKLLREKEREIHKLLANRQAWKEKAAEKLADKFDQYNQKKINELRNLLLKKEREICQLKAVRVRSNSPLRRNLRLVSALALEKKESNLGCLPSSIIAGLQENLEILRSENKELHHKISELESFGRKSRLDNEGRTFSRNRER